ncbi:MAG TPA: geranylgeranyl reductase family protein [Acidimicrobiales bacterium]|nr:geranylgeranyl reductase family protein [Acidimicrobiales bacterium]
MTERQAGRDAPARGGRRRPAGEAERTRDVLVVGGGPAGSACAFWLADAGWDVALVEKKRFPREKTCGDGLTPRAVRQLADMGLEGDLAGAHRYVGLRACGFGRTVDMTWPEHPSFPSYGYTITRHDLDGLVADRAAKAGATVLCGHEATAPVTEDGGGPLPGCLGAEVRETATGGTRTIRARYVVVADGANSRFGRALGTARDRRFPQGMAIRGYYRSPRHDDPLIESHLDLRSADGDVVPGYGWLFPLGDGRVNVGVGLLSTEARWRGANTSRLMEDFVATIDPSWGISPATALGPPTGGRLPMGLAVGPRTGRNVVVIGDAGGGINPFNGEGIAYAYETGRLAAASVGEALAGDGDAALAGYERRVEEAYAAYFRVGRAFVHVISNPKILRRCVSFGLRSDEAMTILLRIMANLMRPDTLGAAELGYQVLEAVGQLVPS